MNECQEDGGMGEEKGQVGNRFWKRLKRQTNQVKFQSNCISVEIYCDVFSLNQSN